MKIIIDDKFGEMRFDDHEVEIIKKNKICYGRRFS